ncbi:hypothetical protein MTO96_025292 [Rhipicephalus appendiculatus]
MAKHAALGIAVFAASLIDLCQAQTNAGCHIETLRSCGEDYVSYQKRPYLEYSGPLFQKQCETNKEQIACTSQYTKDCVKGLSKAAALLALEALQDHVDEVCSNGTEQYHAFQKSAVCLNSVGREIKKCMNVLRASIQIAAVKAPADDVVHYVCCSYGDLLECLDPVLKPCEEDGGKEFITGAFEQVFGETLSLVCGHYHRGSKSCKGLPKLPSLGPRDPKTDSFIELLLERRYRPARSLHTGSGDSCFLCSSGAANMVKHAVLGMAVLAASLIDLCQSQTKPDCKIQTLRACGEDYVSYGHGPHVESSGSLFVKQCETYKQQLDCSRLYIRECAQGVSRAAVLLALEAFQDNVDAICINGSKQYDAFQKSVGCLNSVGTEMNACMTGIRTTMQKAIGKAPPNDVVHYACCSYADLLDCMDSVLTPCEEDGGKEFTIGLLEQVFGETLSLVCGNYRKGSELCKALPKLPSPGPKDRKIEGYLELLLEVGNTLSRRT